jgi:hypothetical protein
MLWEPRPRDTKKWGTRNVRNSREQQSLLEEATCSSSGGNMTSRTMRHRSISWNIYREIPMIGKEGGWRCDLVVAQLPSMCEALGLVPSNTHTHTHTHTARLGEVRISYVAVLFFLMTTNSLTYFLLKGGLKSSLLLDLGKVVTTLTNRIQQKWHY